MMEQLGRADLHAMTRLMRALYELDGLPSFKKRLLAQLPRVVPCDMVIYCENNLRTKESRGFCDFPGASTRRTPGSTHGMCRNPRCCVPTAAAWDRR